MKNGVAKTNTKRLIRIAFFSAIALILGLIENSLPPLLAFAPGAKMGLANVVSLIAFIVLGATDAYAILLIRCILGSIFGGNISSLMYSIPAGMISLTIEIIMFKFLFPNISLISISFVGAIFHNLTQLVIASIIVNFNLLAVLPFTLIASLIAGLFVGVVTWLTVKYLPKKVYLN